MYVFVRSFVRLFVRSLIFLYLKVLQSEGERNPFYMSHQGLNDKDFQVEYGNSLRAICPDLLFTSPHLALPLQYEGHPLSHSMSAIRSNRKHAAIKIGFISSHFNDHSIGLITVQSILSMYLMGKESQDIDVFVFLLDRQMTLNATTGD